MRNFFFLVVFSFSLYSGEIEEKTKNFLGTPYKAGTLIGSVSQKEQLVVDLGGVDCFTFIDQIEALKSDDFENRLINIRYKNSKVDYKSRNHFFSDWKVYNKHIDDITCAIGKCEKITKYLNNKGDGLVYLDGIEIVKREISYISLKNIDFSKLKEGDYIGIYTDLKGLDVTHVGMAVKKDNIWFLRHASSKAKKVIDSDLKEYIKNKKGILVYRSKM